MPMMGKFAMSRSAAMRSCREIMRTPVDQPAYNVMPKLDRLNLVSPFSERIVFSSFVAHGQIKRAEQEALSTAEREQQDSNRILRDCSEQLQREIPLSSGPEPCDRLCVCRNAVIQLENELFNIYELVWREIEELKGHLVSESVLFGSFSESGEVLDTRLLFKKSHHICNEIAGIGGNEPFPDGVQRVLQRHFPDILQYSANRGALDYSKAKTMKEEPLPAEVAQILDMTEEVPQIPFSEAEVVEQVASTVSRFCNNDNDVTLSGSTPGIVAPKLESLIRKESYLEGECLAQCEEIDYWQEELVNEAVWDMKCSVILQAVERFLPNNKTEDIATAFRKMQGIVERIISQLEHFEPDDWVACERILKQRVPSERERRFEEISAEVESRAKKERETVLKQFVGKKCMTASPDRSKERVVYDFRQ